MRSFKSVVFLMLLALWFGAPHVLHSQDATPARQPDDPTSLLAKAQQALLAGDDDATVTAYETLIATHPVRDARVYANLGAAYAHLNQKGQAIWAYTIATALDPRNTAIAADLHQLRDTPPLPLVAQWKAGNLPVVSLLRDDEALLVGMALYLLFWIAAFAWRAQSAPEHRASRRQATLSLGLLFAAWALLVAPRPMTPSPSREPALPFPKPGFR